MKMDSSIVCAIGLLMLGSTASNRAELRRPDVDDRRVPTEAEVVKIYHRGARLLQLTAHGRFILEGTVVDQEGRSLEDVEISLRMTQLTKMGWDSRDDYKMVAAESGRFLVDVRPYYGVNMSFKKRGYYPEQKFFQFEETASWEIAEAIMEGKKAVVTEGVVRHGDILIVMERMGVVTDLTRYPAWMEFVSSSAGDTAGVVVVDFQVSPVPYRERPLKRIAGEPDPERLPPGCAYALADVDGDGHIALEERTYGHRNVTANFPRRIRVVMNDPEGGFIEYEPGEKERAWWTMKQAPESGYSRELIVDADKLIRRIYTIEGTYGGIFFYFKTGSHYGKGEIARAAVRGADKVTISGIFALQPDGTRNVDTGRQ